MRYVHNVIHKKGTVVVEMFYIFLRKGFTMNNHFKKMLLVMVVTVSATAPVHAFEPAPSLHRVRFEQAYAALAKMTASLCGAAKDIVADTVGTVVEVVCNPVDTLEAVATVVKENPKKSLAVAVAGTVLAYMAYAHYNKTQEETPSETVNA